MGFSRPLWLSEWESSAARPDRTGEKFCRDDPRPQTLGVGLLDRHGGGGHSTGPSLRFLRSTGGLSSDPADRPVGRGRDHVLRARHRPLRSLPGRPRTSFQDQHGRAHRWPLLMPAATKASHRAADRARAMVRKRCQEPCQEPFPGLGSGVWIFTPSQDHARSSGKNETNDQYVAIPFRDPLGSRQRNQ